MRSPAHGEPDRTALFFASRTAAVRVLFWVMAMTLVMVSSVFAADRKAAKGAGPKAKRSVLTDAFFADPAVRLFDLQIAPDQLSQLTRNSKVYVPAELREGETVLSTVGVRLKGRGSFRSVSDKPSLAIKFDEFVEDQTYRGSKKLMFNNAVQDISYLSELISTELFRDAGVPAARVTHARLRLNGRDLDLYVVAEAMNKDFLKRHFGNGEGNLYETYISDIDGAVEQDNGEDQSRLDLRELSEACAINDPAERWERLNAVLDVDRFLSFVAMEMLTSHWDGYANNVNNYRIYHDPGTDKMVFIAHGLDGSFKRASFSLQPPLKAIVVTAVMTTPEGKKLYDLRVRKLAAEVFKMPVILERIEKALTKLRSAELTSTELANLERTAGAKRERIKLRGTRVDEQIRGVEPQTLKLDAQGIGIPVAWNEEPMRGNPIFDRVQHEGKKTLHLRAPNELSRGSWRSQMILSPGYYRFEGLVRTEALAGGVARVRISGNSSGVGGIAGSSPWQLLGHNFMVTSDAMDVELVCEMTASQGEVWFDLDSLRVRRLGAAPAAAPMPMPVRRPVIRQQLPIRPPPTFRIEPTR